MTRKYDRAGIFGIAENLTKDQIQDHANRLLRAEMDPKSLALENLAAVEAQARATLPEALRKSTAAEIRDAAPRIDSREGWVAVLLHHIETARWSLAGHDMTPLDAASFNAGFQIGELNRRHTVEVLYGPPIKADLMAQKGRAKGGAALGKVARETAEPNRKALLDLAGRMLADDPMATRAAVFAAYTGPYSKTAAYRIFAESGLFPTR